MLLFSVIPNLATHFFGSLNRPYGTLGSCPPVCVSLSLKGRVLKKPDLADQ